MTTTTVSPTLQDSTQRDALCVQALRMLRTTAKQWGMCLELAPAAARPAAQPLAHPARLRVGKAASNCAGLRNWRVAA